MKNKVILLFTFFLLISFEVYAESPLYTPNDGLDFKYRWLDTATYDTHTFDLHGMHTATPHQFGYDFRQVFGQELLTQAGLNYGYKAGSHWAGIGISSSSDKPFTSLNLIDFNVFYAFRIFQRVTEYENIKGKVIPYYSRLYLGIEYSTERILLDGYPLPIVRYEYTKPNLNVIFGYPLTYIKVDFLKYHSFEFKYVPILDVLVSYNLGFNKNNTLKFQFEMENERYKLSNMIKDVYFSEQEKYYTDLISFRIKYSLKIANVVTLSPYAEFIIDGHRYTSKSVKLFYGQAMGIGYSAGLEINAVF